MDGTHTPPFPGIEWKRSLRSTIFLINLPTIPRTVHVLFAVEAARWKGGSVTWLWPGFPTPGSTPPAPSPLPTKDRIPAFPSFPPPGCLYRYSYLSIPSYHSFSVSFDHSSKIHLFHSLSLSLSLYYHRISLLFPSSIRKFLFPFRSYLSLLVAIIMASGTSFQEETSGWNGFDPSSWSLKPTFPIRRHSDPKFRSKVANLVKGILSLVILFLVITGL